MSATTTTNDAPGTTDETVSDAWWIPSTEDASNSGADKSGTTAEDAATLLAHAVDEVAGLLGDIRKANRTYSVLAEALMDVRRSVVTENGARDYYGATALYKRWVFPRFVDQLVSRAKESDRDAIRKALDSARTNYINAQDWVTEYIARDNTEAIKQMGDFESVEDITPENATGKAVVLRLVPKVAEDAAEDAPAPAPIEYHSGQEKIPVAIAKVVESITKLAPGEVAVKSRVKRALGETSGGGGGKASKPVDEVLREAENAIAALVDSNPLTVAQALRRLSITVAERVQAASVADENGKRSSLPANQGVGNFRPVTAKMSVLYSALDASIQKDADETSQDALRDAIKSASK
jgi:hypothetical protein